MKTYWDLEENERAALTEAEVEAFTAAELMTKGVLRVAVPTYDEEPVEATPEPTMYYRLQDRNDRSATDIAFATAEQAEAFRALSPVLISRKYLGGDYRDGIDHASPISDWEIDTCHAVPAAAFAAAQSAIERLTAVRSSNRTRREEYDRGLKTQNEALEGLWADWLRCRALASRMQKIVDTFREYEEIAGDSETAGRFLQKVFGDEDIQEASKWCDVDIPINVAQPMPAPVDQPAERPEF